MTPKSPTKTPRRYSLHKTILKEKKWFGCFERMVANIEKLRQVVTEEIRGEDNRGIRVESSA